MQGIDEVIHEAKSYYAVLAGKEEGDEDPQDEVRSKTPGIRISQINNIKNIRSYLKSSSQLIKTHILKIPYRRG